MTIRELQYAIQDAIDKGVSDEARVEVGWDKDGFPEIFAVGRDRGGNVAQKTPLIGS